MSQRPQSLYRMVGFTPSASPAERDEFERALMVFVAHWIGVGVLADYYTGISNSLVDRLRQHARNRRKFRWWRELALIVPEHLPAGVSRRRAERFELSRIRVRAPYFNVKGNRGRFNHAALAWADRRFREAFGVRLAWWERVAVFRWLVDVVAGSIVSWSQRVFPYAAGAVVGAVVSAGVVLTMVAPV